MNVNRPGEPGYAGVGATFCKVPLVLDAADLEGADVAIVGAPIDEPVSHRPGARFGPRAIRLADVGGGPWRPNMDVGVNPFEVLTVVDYAHAEVIPGDQGRSHQAIRRAVAEICAAGAVPIVLGGDHSIAHPDVGAVAEHLKPARTCTASPCPMGPRCVVWWRKAPFAAITSSRSGSEGTGRTPRTSNGLVDKDSDGTSWKRSASVGWSR